MKIKAIIDIERDDGKKISDEKQQEIMEQMQDAITDITLDEIVLHEGKANEESVSLNIIVDEVCSA